MTQESERAVLEPVTEPTGDEPAAPIVEPQAPAEPEAPAAESEEGTPTEEGEAAKPEAPAYAQAKEDGSYLTPQEVRDLEEFAPLIDERAKVLAEPMAEEDFQKYRAKHDETWGQKLEEAKRNVEAGTVVTTLSQGIRDITDKLTVLEGTVDVVDLRQLREGFNQLIRASEPFARRLNEAEDKKTEGLTRQYTDLQHALYEGLPSAQRDGFQAEVRRVNGRLRDGLMNEPDAHRTLLKARDKLLEEAWEAKRGGDLKKKASENADAEQRAKARQAGGKPPGTVTGTVGGKSINTMADADIAYAARKISHEDYKGFRKRFGVPDITR